MSEAPSFSVILARPEPPEPMALAKALSAVRRTPLQDQINAAKRAWGILAENLTESEGSRFAGALREAGIETAVVPAPAALPEAQPVKSFESALSDRLILVAAAGMTVTSTTTKTVKEGPSAGQKILSAGILLSTGLPIKIGGSEHTVEKKQTQSDRVFFLDLLYKDPARRRRIDALHFDYSFLQERKLYQVFANFKLLISDLVQTAPAAWRNYGTKVLLEGKPVQTMGYDSLTDLERETRWLLTLQSK